MTLRIRLFGEFSCVYGEEPLQGIGAGRPQSLLAYLLLHRQAPQLRHYVAFLLWPDTPESQARTNLRNLLHTVRQSLPHADDFVTADANSVQWRPGAPYTLDVDDFQDALAQAVVALDADLRRQWLERAVAVYTGDLLPSNADDWLAPLREELRLAHSAALDELVELLEQQGDTRAAIRYGQRQIQADPVDEVAYVQLMRQHALAGDRSGVRRVFQQCESALRRELGVAPAPATVEAYNQLLRLGPVAASPLPQGEPQVRHAPEPALEPVATALRPRDLPSLTTTFLGRAQELAAVAELLAQPACRLLTIVGPGGLGKTRLALQCASGHRSVFRDGVAYVPFTGQENAERLTSSMADALQFAFSGTNEGRAQLLDFLRDRELLIVIDNFEHLADGSDLLAEVLVHAPDIKLLVTSRRRLNLVEEWVFELEGMPLPENTRGEDNAAAALFVQSARRVQHDFAPSEEDFGAIGAICRSLGGNPLGIELAASWVRVLAPQEIANEIGRSLDFVATSLRNVPERHRSLRTVFDQSWRLLSTEEQQVLPRLSVFRGGFTREAAEWTAGAILPILLSLVDKSLVRRTKSGRFDVHELVQQYAHGMLTVAPQNEFATRKNHADFFARWLQRSEPHLKSGAQHATAGDLAADLDNIRLAFQWAVANRRLDYVLRMTPCLFWLFEIRGYFREALAALEQHVEVLRVAGAPQSLVEPDELAAFGLLLDHLGWFAFRNGQAERAQALLAESLEVARAHGTPLVLYYVYVHLAWVAWSIGEGQEAAAYADEGLRYAETLDTPWYKAIVKTVLGGAAMQRGLPQEAYEIQAGAIEVWQAAGDPRGLSVSLALLSDAAQHLGQVDEAVRALQESVALSAQAEDPWAQATALNLLGEVTQRQGRHEVAQVLFRQSYALYRQMGDRLSAARALVNIAHSACVREERAEARDAFEAAFVLGMEAASIPVALDALSGLARMLVREGGVEQGMAWLAFVLAHPLAPDAVRQRTEAAYAEAASWLSPAQLGGICRHTESLTLEKIVADLQVNDRAKNVRTASA